MSSFLYDSVSMSMLTQVYLQILTGFSNLICPNKVQRRLQLRIEAQGKYLQSILEKACKVLNDQAVASAGLEAAREELSELAIKVASDCQGVASVPPLTDVTAGVENTNTSNFPARIGDCSIDSCLTSNESPVSPLGGGGSQTATMKKRPRPVLAANGESLPLDDDNLPQGDWVMSNIGS